MATILQALLKLPTPKEQQFINCAKRLQLYGGAKRGGKGFRPTELVVTPFGLREIGSLKIGERISNPDGTNARVVGVFHRGIQPMYRITFSDGVIIDCDSEHLWAARKSRQHKSKRRIPYRVVPTWLLMEWLEEQHEIMLPVTRPVSFTKCYKHNQITIDPYSLGAILGDGCITTRNPVLHCVDREIIQRIPYIRNKNKLTPPFHLAGIEKELSRLGLKGSRSWEKFIPSPYLWASVAQRWELLRGLMDTDGTASKEGKLYFTTTSQRLADDVAWLVRSLGGMVQISTKIPTFRYLGNKKSGRLAYNLIMRFRDATKAFHLNRKKARAKSSPLVARRIVHIEPIPPEETVCIAVDHSNGLFLTKDFVVTHNTFAGCMKAILLSTDFPGNRGLIGRQSSTDLRDSTLTTFAQIVNPEMILDHLRGERKFLIRTSGKPSEILYRGLGEEGEEEKVKGMDLGWYWIDEPSEVPRPTWMMLHAQLNWVLPDGSRPPYMGMLTSNPEPGWVKKLKDAIESGKMQEAEFIRALPRDNPHLPPGWEQELRDNFPEEWCRKYLDGSWDVSEGQVFTELNERDHNLDNWTDLWSVQTYKDWVASLKIGASIDHATTGVTAMAGVGLDRGENMYALEEYYERDRTVSEHAKEMLSVLGGLCTASRPAFMFIDPSTERKDQVGKQELYSILDEYKRQNQVFNDLLKPAVRSEIRIGINRMKEMLKVNPNRIHPFTGQHGSPSLFISKKRNRRGWNEMVELENKINAAGEIEYKGSDHWIDNIRYIVMSKLPDKFKKAEVANVEPEYVYAGKGYDSDGGWMI